jgi:uncharacterized membrane protein
MRASSLHYFPLSGPILLILAIGLVILVALLELRVLRYAYEKLGINPRYVTALLLLSLLGAYVNIPVAEIPGERVVPGHIEYIWGVGYVVPEVEERTHTIIAVNLGGAIIPTFLSLYLMFKNALFLRSLLGTAIVAAVVHWLARPVQGVGITVPTFVPPLLAAGVALLLAWWSAAPLAYIIGSLGTLIGADLLNLGKVSGLGAPVASIGGAGTFDGIFLTGILAVLLAPAGGRPRAAPLRGPDSQYAPGPLLR